MLSFRSRLSQRRKYGFEMLIKNASNCLLSGHARAHVDGWMDGGREGWRVGGWMGGWVGGRERESERARERGKDAENKGGRQKRRFHKLRNWKFTLQMNYFSRSTPDSCFFLFGTHQWCSVLRETCFFGKLTVVKSFKNVSSSDILQALQSSPCLCCRLR